MFQSLYNWIRRSWSRHFLICETILVAIVWIGIIIWAKHFNGEQSILDTLDGRRGLIYGTIAAILGSLLGFVIAAQSIVLGLSGSEKLEVVRQSEHYPTLWCVFRWSIRTLAIATIAALLVLIFDCDQSPCMLWLYVGLFPTLLAIAQLARTIWVLEQVVKVVSAEKRK